MDSWDRLQVYAKQSGKYPLFANGEITPKQGRRYVKKYWRDQKLHEKWLAETRAKVREGTTAEDLKLAGWELEILMAGEDVD